VKQRRKEEIWLSQCVCVCVCVSPHVCLSERRFGFRERGRRRKFESEYVCVHACMCRGMCAGARAYAYLFRWGREGKKNFYLLARVSFGVWCVGSGSREARLVGEQGRETLERIRGLKKRYSSAHTYI